MKKYLFFTTFLFSIISTSTANAKDPVYFTGRTSGMGGAGVAVADDRTALQLNPAGLNVLRDKLEISSPALSLNYSPYTWDVGPVTGIRIGHFANSGSIDRYFIKKLKKVEGKHINNTLLTEIAGIVFKNFGFMLYGSSGVDAVYDAGIYEQFITYSSRTEIMATGAVSKRINRTLSMGLSLDYIFRLEAPETVVWERDIERISVEEIFSNTKDTLDINDEIKKGFAVNTGVLWHLGYFRLGGTLRNLAGSIDGEPFSRQLDLGAAFWVPQLLKRGLLDRVLIAADIHDALSNRYFWTKTHIGIEADMPTGALRAGINQGYPTWGFEVKFLILHFEFADYSKELGEYPGHIRDHSYLLALRLGL